MRGEELVKNQLLMAQAIGALADHIDAATGYQIAPVTFALLPTAPALGMVACVNNSTVNTWGSVIAGGGSFKVLVWYNGTAWTVIGK